MNKLESKKLHTMTRLLEDSHTQELSLNLWIEQMTASSLNKTKFSKGAKMFLRRPQHHHHHPSYHIELAQLVRSAFCCLPDSIPDVVSFLASTRIHCSLARDYAGYTRCVQLLA